jgi:hypothetical protein
MAKKKKEKMITISSHKGNAIKTTLRFHHTLFRIASKTPPPTGVGDNVGKKEPWYTAGVNAS